MKPPASTTPIANTKGSIIIFALVLLLVMTLLGVSTGQSIVYQERMSGQAQDRAISFQAAEAALRFAERTMLTATPAESAFIGNDDGLFDMNDNPPPDVHNIIDISDNTTNWLEVQIGNDTDPQRASRHARYMVERMVIFIPNPDPALPPDTLELYKVTAQGFGASADTDTVLQSFVRP